MRLFQYKRTWLLTLLVWLGLIAGGYVWLLRYSFASGKNMTAPRSIPPSLAPLASSTRAQLFVALHPHCPCSRATVHELAKILTRAANVSDVTVLLFKPANQPESWSESPLVKDCRQMNCRILSDPDGRLAASLGSLTSGTVALYDRSGQLRYQGGITASRGHEGDNGGETAVIEILRGKRDSYRSLPAFGCPIQQEVTKP
jgi:hypothetical protein